ncbi:MAG: hypothetical protein KGL39_56965 [Patescibacteria group bacterium]|nr:hypothetical protein [Patescibacteria group bacterium]
MPFDVAYEALARLEEDAVPRMIKSSFTLDDVIACCWPKDTIETLKAAFPLTKSENTAKVISPLSHLFPSNGPTGSSGLIHIDTYSANMLPPADPVNWQAGPQTAELKELIVACHQAHAEFEKIRKVIGWLNLNATPGAAKHYCPWMASLLPADHAFHTARGDTFREPAGLGAIAGDMRACSVIIASALLAIPAGTTGKRGKTQVYLSMPAGMGGPCPVIVLPLVSVDTEPRKL